MATKQKSLEETTLQELVNDPVLVNAFGKTYEIRRFGLGQTARALEHIGPLRFIFQQLIELPKDKKGRMVASEGDMINLALTALQISGESALGLISVATSEPVEWLEDKDPLDGLEILVAVIEKNKDFFSPQNIERVKGLFGRLQHKIPALGGDMSTP